MYLVGDPTSYRRPQHLFPKMQKGPAAGMVIVMRRLFSLLSSLKDEHGDPIYKRFSLFLADPAWVQCSLFLQGSMGQVLKNFNSNHIKFEGAL